MDREAMDFDVVIVGAGPAGLAAAIRLKQRAAEVGREVSDQSAGCFGGLPRRRLASFSR